MSVFDLDGMVWECRISKADQKRAALEALAPVKAEAPKAKVHIAQCLPKGKTFDDIIRQSVEVGASGIFPLMSEHSQVRLDEKDALKKHEKWRTQVVEAVKQSANFSGYGLAPAQTFKDFMANLPNFDLKLVASLQEGTQPILKTLRERGENAKSICVLVGPEGDLSEREYATGQWCGLSALHPRGERDEMRDCGIVLTLSNLRLFKRQINIKSARHIKKKKMS